MLLGLVIHTESKDNWVSRYNDGELLGNNWFKKYVYAFYWAITTMTTVGLGDLSPNNFYEVVCFSVFMLIATIMFSYYFNTIGMLIQDLNKKNK